MIDTQLDIRYALLLGSRLEQFKIKSSNPYKINFRCPFCGDSQRSKTLSRGWLTQSKKGGLRFKCFNCDIQLGKSNSFYDFIKQIDPILFKDYITDRYITDKKTVAKDDIPEEIKKKSTFDTSPLKRIKKLSQLPHNHPAKNYIENRKIPSDKHYLIYYAPKFKTWINSIIPNKFPVDKDGKVKREEPRIILPFFDKDGSFFGLSARGFDPNGLRYISIMLDDTKPKIFGLERVDFNKPYSIVEGAFDSLFLENSIAMAGADGNLKGLSNIENATLVFDCEFRNKQILDKLDKAIEKNINVCIWPEYMSKNGKDINQFIENGLTKDEIEMIIKSNTYKGLMAKTILIERKRV